MASLLTTVRDLERLRQIVGVLVRHGFGELVQRLGWASLLPGKAANKHAQEGRLTLGERILAVLLDLGPSFVKLGQIVSTRPDLIPADIIDELKKLQDEVPPLPFAEMRPMVEEQLGATLEEVFSSFDEQPLASASIGQVHRAMLRNGDEPDLDVVVKIQRPKIKDTIDRDIDLLYWMAHAIERSIPESKLYSPVRLVAEFDRAINAELDFTLEADNAERFTKNFEEFEPKVIHFPRVYRRASSRKVLTLEFLEGHKVTDAVAAGVEGERIAKNSVAVIIKQIFEDGFFHADPHPGNIIIQGTPEQPVVAMIDLGLVGRLTPQLRDKTIDLMVAAASEDYRAIADALYAIGTPTKKIDRNEFEAEVAVLADKYLGKQLKDIEFSGLIRDLVNGATKYGLEIPPDFLMVGKSLMTVEGIGKQVYPELDVFEEVKPYFQKLMWLRYSPEKMSQELVRGMTRLSGAAVDMPMQMQEILEDVRKGDLQLHMTDDGLPSAADRLGRRFFSGLVVASCIISGTQLIIAGHQWVGGMFLTIGAFWAGSHSALVAWLGRKRKRL